MRRLHPVMSAAATVALAALLGGCADAGRPAPAETTRSPSGASAPATETSTPEAEPSPTAPAATNGSTADATPEEEPAGDGTASVRIVAFRFEPAELEAPVGTTVTWTNFDDDRHRVKWEDGAPDSGSLSERERYRRTFDAAGTFPYVCGIHPQMKATVVVGGG